MNRQFFRDYFSFNRKERNGVVVLLCILLILLVYLTYQKLNEAEKKSENQLKERPFQNSKLPPKDNIENENFKTKQEVEQKDNIEKKNERSVPVYFYFNPNTLSAEGWKKLGLSEKQTHIILNYVSKGGKFREKEDLRKIYGLPPEQEQKLEPYANVPVDSARFRKVFSEKEVGKDKPLFSSKLKAGEKLDLNHADSIALLKLPCVGPAFAHRILVYREKLGGYYSPSQLMEVFGMDDERFNCLGDHLLIDTNSIRKIHVNVATIEELRMHPYIKWKLANLIVNYRKQHGYYRSPADLKRLDLMDEDLLEKLSPYVAWD